MERIPLMLVTLRRLQHMFRPVDNAFILNCLDNSIHCILQRELPGSDISGCCAAHQEALHDPTLN